jgi:glucose/mannose transport system permease protein
MIRRLRRWGPGFLLVLPSLVLLGVFVYGFIGWNVRVSFSDWMQFQESSGFVGVRRYTELFENEVWWRDVQHLVIFTLVFVGGSLLFGFGMAWLLEKGVRGETFFRSIYLFPMAISFIAVAIVWRWLLDNGTGANTAGINKLFTYVGLDSVHLDWHRSAGGWAVAAVALPAAWALTGYVMALFLAGMRGVPDELREAARVDGAREHQVFWHVVRPMLWPVVLSALVILAHISLKTFDLIYAIDLRSPRIETPAVLMWFTTFQASFFARGAAIATLLLLAVAVFIVPYIWYSLRTGRRR